MASSDVGFDFFVDCFTQYWSGKLLVPILFIFSVIYVLIKKDKLWNRSFVFPFVFGACTIFNPFIMGTILEKLGWYNRYYRFYWIIPFSLFISVVIIDISDLLKQKWSKVIFVVLLLGLVVSCGNSIVFSAKNWNLYKVSNDTMDVCEIIREDTSEESPYILADITIIDTLRQYDPSIISVLSLNEILVLDYEFEQMYDLYMRKGRVLVLMANYNVEIEAELINVGLQNQEIDYFVRDKEWYSEEYISSLNVLKVGESEKYEVYRVLQQK